MELSDKFYQKLNLHYLDILRAGKLCCQNSHDLGKKDFFVKKISGITLDYRRNIINLMTIDLLMGLVKQCNSTNRIRQLFSHGNSETSHLIQDGAHISFRARNHNTHLKTYLDKMIRFTYFNQSGNNKFKHIIHIGMGGSDLGPRLVVNALQEYHCTEAEFSFISGGELLKLEKKLKTIEPKLTLIIIASKSFQTCETLSLAKIAKSWLASFISHNLIAITAYPKKAREFGVSEKNIFSIPINLTGRYSLWSSIGLSIMLAVGSEHFQQLLDGARYMDEHFLNTELSENLPIILAMLTIWYRNFFKISSQAVCVYSDYLSDLPSYLQQLEMESNGKSITRSGERINYNTAPVVFGAVGTNAQHTFLQAVHQGTDLIPIDFILPLNHKNHHYAHSNLNIASCLAQAEALACGEGVPDGRAPLAHQMNYGNKPSNLIIIDELSPNSLGKLLAMYEHKTFIEGVVWKINSFDQWGVELGKRLTIKYIKTLDSLAKINVAQLLNL